MFLIKNRHSDLNIEYVFGDKKIDFVIEYIVNRRLEGIFQEETFYILNAFIAQKSPAFKEELYNRLVKAKNGNIETTQKQNLEPIAYGYIHNVMDLFDFEEIKKFIERTNIIVAPSKLMDTFDEVIVINEEGTRIQTYLKSEYIDLVVLLTIMKSVLGPIGEFATFNQSKIPDNYKEYILINFFETHAIKQSKPYQKLSSYVSILTNVVLLDDKKSSLATIENFIPKEELATYFLAQTLIQRLLTSSETQDTSEKHIVTRLYNYVYGKLGINSKGRSSSNINIKKLTGRGGDEDSESIFETYHLGTDLTIGYIEEFKYALADPYTIARQLSPEIDLSLASDALNFLQGLNSSNIQPSIIKLLGWIIKDIIDPRSLEDYIVIKYIINGLAAAFAYLWTYNFKELAIIITSVKGSDEFIINSSSKSKITAEDRETLAKIFPNMRAVAGNEGVKYTSYIEEAINKMGVELSKNGLTPLASDKYLQSATGGVERITYIPDNIKQLLSKLVIQINQPSLTNVSS